MSYSVTCLGFHAPHHSSGFRISSLHQHLSAGRRGCRGFQFKANTSVGLNFLPRLEKKDKVLILRHCSSNIAGLNVAHFIRFLTFLNSGNSAEFLVSGLSVKLLKKINSNDFLEFGVWSVRPVFPLWLCCEPWNAEEIIVT